MASRRNPTDGVVEGRVESVFPKDVFRELSKG